jgi:hypothetical protein
LPRQILDVGNGQVYVHNDALAAFVNGHVSDVLYL